MILIVRPSLAIAFDINIILQSDKIRTIIKARGISYPNVTGKTFAVFRVDQEHHLISVVSFMCKYFTIIKLFIVVTILSHFSNL